MASTPPTTRLTWDEFDRHCATLARKIKASGTEFCAILAVLRGGAVAGVKMAHLLQISTMLCIGIRRTASDEPNPAWQEPEVTGTEILHLLRGRKVLIIDDVCNYGTTLRLARNCLLQAKPATVKTAAVIWDRGGTAECDADFHGGETPGWALLPWE